MTPAAILLAVSSIAFCVVALLAARRERKAPLVVRDRRVLEASAHEEMLVAAGACGHEPGVSAPGCDCRQGRPW